MFVKGLNKSILFIPEYSSTPSMILRSSLTAFFFVLCFKEMTYRNWNENWKISLLNSNQLLDNQNYSSIIIKIKYVQQKLIHWIFNIFFLIFFNGLLLELIFLARIFFTRLLIIIKYLFSYHNHQINCVSWNKKSFSKNSLFLIHQ